MQTKQLNDSTTQKSKPRQLFSLSDEGKALAETSTVVGVYWFHFVKINALVMQLCFYLMLCHTKEEFSGE